MVRGRLLLRAPRVRAARGIGTRSTGRCSRSSRARDSRNAFAGIALPNAASVRLHESVGFTPLGVYRDVGFKLGAWRDTVWWQLPRRPPDAAPRPLAPPSAG